MGGNVVWRQWQSNRIALGRIWQEWRFMPHSSVHTFLESMLRLKHPFPPCGLISYRCEPGITQLATADWRVRFISV